MTSRRFDAALAGTTWTGTVEEELEGAAVALPDVQGPRLTLLRPGSALVPWGAEVPWYRPPRTGERVEVVFEGPGVDLTTTPVRGRVGGCPWHLLRLLEPGDGPVRSGVGRIVGALAAAFQLEAPWLDEFRAAVRAIPRDATGARSREMLDHAADGRFPETLCEYVRALGDPWLPPREVRALAVRLVNRPGALSGADMLEGVEAVTGEGSIAGT